MKYNGILLNVSDLARSKQFYHKVLGLGATTEAEGYAVLEGGIVLREQKMPGPGGVRGDVCELHFEESGIERFAERLACLSSVSLCHPLKEEPWGQKVIRFCDPDGVVIAVEEPMKEVVGRFAAAGLAPHQIAKQMRMPLNDVLGHLADYS